MNNRISQMYGYAVCFITVIVMLIAIKHLFERLPPTAMHIEQRRLVFERFISSCIDDYFTAEDTPSTS